MATEPHDVRGLTVRQPWASLIACGAKTIETSDRSTDWRGDLLVHAGKARPDMAWEGGGWAIAHLIKPGWMGHMMYRHAYDVDGVPLPLGAVVAVARLADCAPVVDEDGQGANRTLVVNHTDGALRLARYPGGVKDVTDQRALGDFTPGRWAWLLTDVRPIDPVPAEGRQGLWKPSGELVVTEDRNAGREDDHGTT